ncbi:hypothetical protein LRQ11_00710, partial [Pseudomonas sp. MAFF 311095]|uniref:hypothetical protein n=1 Tax=Pseudomonas petroselini TaxID=2899822 RepID=UPI0020B217D9
VLIACRATTHNPALFAGTPNRPDQPVFFRLLFLPTAPPCRSVAAFRYAVVRAFLVACIEGDAQLRC